MSRWRRQLRRWLPLQLWRFAARLFRAMGHHALAARAYAVVADRQPLSAASQHDLGTALATVKRHEPAARAFRRALALEPDSGRSHRALGRTHRALGQSIEAAQAFIRAAQLLPDNAELACELGTALALLGRHQEAVEAFQAAARLAPTNPKYQRALGRAYGAAGQHVEAAAALEQGGSERAERARAHFFLGRQWLARGEPARAVEPLQRSLALLPDHADSAFALHACLEALHWRLPTSPGDNPPAPPVDSLSLLGDWREALTACTEEWTCLFSHQPPAPLVVEALYRRAEHGIGLVTDSVTPGGPLLGRTSLLQACLATLPADLDGPALEQWLKSRLVHRTLQPAPSAPLAAPIATEGDAWIMHAQAEPDAIAQALAACYRTLGFKTRLVALADLPPTPDALRESALRHMPLLVHDLSAQPSGIGAALRGLRVTLLHEAGELGLGLGCLTAGEQAERGAIHYARLKPDDPNALRGLARAARYRVGCVLGGGIGNMVQCSPAIRRLSEALGQPVDVLLQEDFPGCAWLFSGAPWVATVFSRAADAEAVHFDLLVILDPFTQQMPTFIADRLAVPRLLLPPSKMQRLHETEFYLKGLRETLGVPYQARDLGAYFVGSYTRLPGASRRIGLHAGCKAGRWRAKRWPYFEALAQRLAAAGMEVLCFGGAGEAVPGAEDRTGLTLADTIEQIAACTYFISNDSGLMHVADALGVPLMAIFGPSSVIKNGPLAPTSDVVKLAKACSPCQFDSARLSRCKCIGEISLEQVWNAVLGHLRRLPGIASLASQLQASAGTATFVRFRPTLSTHERLRALAHATDPIDELLAAFAQRHYSSRLMERLIEAGAWHEARALLGGPAGSITELLELGQGEFDHVLHFSWLLGAQEELVNTMAPAVGRLVRAYPNSVLPLCDCAATVLGPVQLDALLLECLPPLVAGYKAKPVLGLIQAACQYASAATLASLLMALDRSEHFELLRSVPVARLVGEALLGVHASFTLPRCGRTDADYRPYAAPEGLIEQALLNHDRPMFVAQVNAFLAEGRGANNLSKVLRTYTQHTARLHLAAGDIHYSLSDSDQDNLRLALILHDTAMVERSVGQFAAGDMATMLWRARHHDYAPLNTALAHWLADVGAVPITFEGRNRLEVFRAGLAIPSLPAAVDHGLVSVILCVHDPEPELLQLAVASVLGQTYRNLELILVDDGNEAAVTEQIAAFAGPRVRVVRNPRNSGVYFSRNLGVAAATGAFVAFHDADDIAHPQRLDVQVTALLEMPGCQLCFASHIRFDASGGLQWEVNPDRLNILGDGPVTALMRRHTLQVVGPFADVRSRGDIEMRQRVAKCFGEQAIRYLTAPLMYCSGGASTLSTRTVMRYPQQLRLLRRSFNLRLWPPVLDGALAQPPLGRLAVPYPLRSSTPQG